MRYPPFIRGHLPVGCTLCLSTASVPEVRHG